MLVLEGASREEESMASLKLLAARERLWFFVAKGLEVYMAKGLAKATSWTWGRWEEAWDAETDGLNLQAKKARKE